MPFADRYMKYNTRQYVETIRRNLLLCSCSNHIHPSLLLGQFSAQFPLMEIDSEEVDIIIQCETHLIFYNIYIINPRYLSSGIEGHIPDYTSCHVSTLKKSHFVQTPNFMLLQYTNKLKADGPHPCVYCGNSMQLNTLSEAIGSLSRRRNSWDGSVLIRRLTEV